MDAEDTILDDGRQAQIVKDFCTVPKPKETCVKKKTHTRTHTIAISKEILPPNIHRPKLSQAFIVESVNLCDLSALVVSTNQCDAIGITNLEREQKKECLDRVEAAIDKVTHEEIVCVGNIAANFEQFAEIVKLAVNVTTDLIIKQIRSKKK